MYSPLHLPFSFPVNMDLVLQSYKLDYRTMGWFLPHGIFGIHNDLFYRPTSRTSPSWCGFYPELLWWVAWRFTDQSTWLPRTWCMSPSRAVSESWVCSFSFFSVCLLCIRSSSINIFIYLTFKPYLMYLVFSVLLFCILSGSPFTHTTSQLCGGPLRFWQHYGMSRRFHSLLWGYLHRGSCIATPVCSTMYRLASYGTHCWLWT